MTEDTLKGPAKRKAIPKALPKADQVFSESTFRKLMRGPLRTWKLYRSSKTGLVGLGIVLGFLIMAVFAPILSPYSTDFRAPAEDVFYANNVEIPIVEHYNWSAPMGLLADTREQQLTGVMVGSADAGKALIFGVSTSKDGGIFVDNPETHSIPQGYGYVQYVHFPRVPSETSYFLIQGGSKVYEYSDNLINQNVEWNLGFEPKFISNLWNGYTLALRYSRLAIVMADEHNVWLYDKVPRDALGLYPVRTFTDNLTISDVTIIGSPLVVDGDFKNGSMVIIPTDSDLRAYSIEVNKSGLTGIVQDVRLGPQIWRKNYTLNHEAFTPIASKHMITFPYAQGASDSFGKTTILLATTRGDLIAYQRETGEIAWSGPLIMPGITKFDISNLYPSPAGVIVTGKAESHGFIAGVDAETGSVRYNRTMFSLTEGYINSPPQYVDGLGTFVYSSDRGLIYLSNGLLGINATFAAPSGGALTPVSYLGNIYIQTSVTGNYFTVVTAKNTLYVATLSGINKAPLPPGKYPSGNRYLLGTDYEGHDILAWIMYGTRSELMVGITAAFVAVVIGTVVGLVAGFYTGMVDSLLMRLTDVMLSLPGLVILLLFAAVFGPSLINIMIIIAILSWAGIARVIRSVTLSLKERAFVDAAIIAGASESRLIFRHIAPNVLPYTFLYMTFTISGAIVTEAILAFLGFGDVNHVTWGMMLQFLQISGHSLTAWWWLLPPGICITLLSLSFYLIGRAFDEVVNPRLRKR